MSEPRQTESPARPRYYLRDLGGAIRETDSVDSWIEMLRDPERWLIEQTPIIGDVFVSTIFLGRENRRDEPSWLFQTQVFNGPCHGYGQRYATEAEAVEGHLEVVKRVHQAMRGRTD